MQVTQDIENHVLEQLNAGKTVCNLLIAAVSLLSDAVENLLTRVFRKDDYAVKYAVEPLLNHHGPLGDLPVRFKLLYGLGVLSRADYEDCELLLALRDELLRDNPQHELAHNFTDDSMLGSLSALHCVTMLPTPPQVALYDDPALSAMQQQRYQQMVRSSVVLSLSGLISRISAHRVFSRD